MNDYYVYRHIRLDTKTPFYVGKGRRYRAGKTSSRNPCWNSIAKTSGFRPEIVAKNLKEDEAFAKEAVLVKLYKSFGFCEANFTDGGHGPLNPRLETRRKMRAAKLGTRSAVNKVVFDNSTGEIFQTIREAAMAIGMKRQTLNAMLRGKNPNKTNIKYYEPF